MGLGWATRRAGGEAAILSEMSPRESRHFGCHFLGGERGRGTLCWSLLGSLFGVCFGAHTFVVTFVVTFWSLWWSLFCHFGCHFCCFSGGFWTFAYFGVELRRVTCWSLLGSLVGHFDGHFLAWSFDADIFVIQFFGPPRVGAHFAQFFVLAATGGSSLLSFRCQPAADQ